MAEKGGEKLRAIDESSSLIYFSITKLTELLRRDRIVTSSLIEIVRLIIEPNMASKLFEVQNNQIKEDGGK